MISTKGEKRLNNNCQLIGDPILYFLYTKLKLSTILVGLLSIAIASAIIPWAIYTEVWSGIYYSLYNSFHTWIGDIVLGATNALILYYYLSFPRLFKRVYEFKIIDDGTSSFVSLYSYISTKFYNKKRHLIVVLISLLVAILMQYQWLIDLKHGWTETSPTGGISFLGYYHLVYFTLEVSILINFFINVFYTISLFRRLEKKVLKGKLKYNFVRLCQYNTGGLKPLGDIAMQIIMVLFTLGLYTALIVFSIIRHSAESDEIQIWQVSEFLSLAVYLILAPTIFFLILTPIHRLMKRKKDSLYELLRIKDNEIAILEKGSLKELFEKSKTFEKIKFNNELFVLIRELPTWPFNFTSITKLVTMTILPILPIIFERIIDGIK